MIALNNAQFDGSPDIDKSQKRRKLRRQGLLGAYVGLGNLWTDYPYMYGTMGTGGIAQMHERGETREQEIAEHDAGTDAGETAPITTGMGDGGTVSGITGAAGGGMP